VEDCLIQSLWVLGRERGLFARRQDLGLCGLCNKEGVLGYFDASADVNGFEFELS
jgi:hypothetical protein